MGELLYPPVLLGTFQLVLSGDVVEEELYAGNASDCGVAADVDHALEIGAELEE